eukprot:Hpha_TRINITY_DN15511_c2_g2::TRINITY_DN15511_c2_g2_i2::g.103793::m.103793
MITPLPASPPPSQPKHEVACNETIVINKTLFTANNVKFSPLPPFGFLFPRPCPRPLSPRPLLFQLHLSLSKYADSGFMSLVAWAENEGGQLVTGWKQTAGRGAGEGEGVKET